MRCACCRAGGLLDCHGSADDPRPLRRVQVCSISASTSSCARAVGMPCDREIGDYLRSTYITTSGNFRTPTLLDPARGWDRTASCSRSTIRSRSTRTRRAGSTAARSRERPPQDRPRQRAPAVWAELEMVAARDTGAVLVAGGGIGGLAAVLALVREGYRVKVIEQAGQIGGSVPGIQLSPNAFAACDARGVGARAAARQGGLHRRDGDVRRARCAAR